MSPRLHRLVPALFLLYGACAPSRPPNVLLVTLDTTRADSIGAYGGDASTPTWDRVAREGVRFDRAYSVTPLTIPAHSSLFTGLYPPRHGVRDNGDFFLDDRTVTLAERLSGAGYATMASVGAEVTSHHWGFAQGFDQFFDDMGDVGDPANRWRVERTGDRVVDDALSWYQGAKPKEKPWFVWLHLFDAHHPYEPPEAYARAAKGKRYLGEISYADAQVARVLTHLESTGELQNTWVILVADHGESLGAHGEAMHGVLLYDPTTRIPLVVRAPEGAPARVIDSPVSIVDLSPTILALTGLAAAETQDGVDLLPMILGEKGSDPTRNVYVESQYAWRHYGWAPQSALVTHEDKLISSTTPELYRRADREETSNIAPTEAALLQARQATLTALTDRLMPGEAATRVDLSAEQIAQLEALGYVTASHEGLPTEGRPDPVSQLPLLKRLDRARAAFREGDLDRARVAVDEVIAAAPELTEARLLRANILARQGKLDEALAEAEALETLLPGSATELLLGTLSIQSGRPKEAIDWMAKALARDPYQARAWVVSLRAMWLIQDPRLPAEAARAYSLLPDDAEILGLHGVALAAAGKFDRAGPMLDRAATLNPDQALINHARAMAYLDAGDPIRAEACLEEEIRIGPPAVASRRLLVSLYADQARYAEQLEQLTEIRGRETPNPETLHSIAQAQFNLQRFPEALSELEDCRTLAPAYSGCALLEANTLKKLGRDAEALEALARARKLQGAASPQRPRR